MNHNQLSHGILSLLLSTAFLCGCNKHPMTAMSKEENSWQESVGGITILEAEHLEAMDSARVPAIIDVVQEEAAHGSSTIQEIVGGTDPISQASDATCVSDTRLFVPPSVSVLQAVPVGLCTLLVGGYIARKIQCYRTALATAEKEARTERDQEIAQTRNALAEALAREHKAVENLVARDQEIAQTRNALATALRTLGEAEWKQYFGDVGAAPDLPSHIAAILDGPCPFWPHKKVRDTHLLVLIPATVDGVPFTLNLLGELIKHPSHGGHRTEYKYYHDRVKAQIGEESPPRSYWVLLTRDVLPESRSKVYADQKALVAGYASREGVPYALPSVLEAATAILMHHACAGERLFGDHPWTCTRCPEAVDGSYPAVVGGFGSSGIVVSYGLYDRSSRCRGVACCRKF
jgi:hypothetical protein